jgi:transcriptional regulator with XRE-family HTH domain
MAEYDQELIALGRAIHQVREERGMSVSELAGAAGVERQLLDALEGGGLDPAYDVMLALADGLGVELTALVIRAEGADTYAACVAFGRRVRKLRSQRGMSQDDLARRTSVHPTAVGRLERGAREPRLTTILRIARGLDVQPGALLDELGGTTTQG